MSQYITLYNIICADQNRNRSTEGPGIKHIKYRVRNHLKSNNGYQYQASDGFSSCCTWRLNDIWLIKISRDSQATWWSMCANWSRRPTRCNLGKLSKPSRSTHHLSDRNDLNMCLNSNTQGFLGIHCFQWGVHSDSLVTGTHFWRRFLIPLLWTKTRDTRVCAHTLLLGLTQISYWWNSALVWPPQNILKLFVVYIWANVFKQNVSWLL